MPKRRAAYQSKNPANGFQYLVPSRVDHPIQRIDDDGTKGWLPTRFFQSNAGVGLSREEAEARVRDAFFEATRRALDVVVEEFDLPSRPRVRVEVSFSPRVKRSRFGFRRGARLRYAGASYVAAAAFDDEIYHPEYAAFDAHPEIGGAIGHWVSIVTKVACHEVAHLVAVSTRNPRGTDDPFYGLAGDVLPNVDDLEGPHGIGWQWIYRVLRRRLVNAFVEPAQLDRRRNRLVFVTAEAAEPRTTAGLTTNRTEPAIAVPARSRGRPRAARSAPSSGSVRAGRYRLTVDANPKRRGSAARERFAALLNAADAEGYVDVGKAYERGYTRADLRYDLGKGFVEPVEKDG